MSDALNRRAGLIMILLVVAAAVGRAADGVTVRHDGRTIAVERTLDDPRDLWVTPEDLTRINGFVLKPEGACLEEICIPVRQDRDSDLLITRAGAKWFNITAFARKIQQTFSVDRAKRVWTFGPLPFKKTRTATVDDDQLHSSAYGRA
jgi:hypothetical protein